MKSFQRQRATLFARRALRFLTVVYNASLPATKKWLTDNKWQMAQPFAI
jgi:hypothetical protein